MPEVILRDHSGHPVIGVADDGLSVHLFDDMRQQVPMIAGSGRVDGATAAIANLLTVNVPHNVDHSYSVSADVSVTASTTHAFTVTCTYTDEAGVPRTLTLSFGLVAGGAFVTSIANGNGAVPYMGVPQRIRAKRGTTIVVATTGTFTAVVYNAEASARLVA
jgi:hypothetical protein